MGMIFFLKKEEVGNDCNTVITVYDKLAMSKSKLFSCRKVKEDIRMFPQPH